MADHLYRHGAKRREERKFEERYGKERGDADMVAKRPDAKATVDMLATLTMARITMIFFIGSLLGGFLDNSPRLRNSTRM